MVHLQEVGGEEGAIEFITALITGIHDDDSSFSHLGSLEFDFHASQTGDSHELLDLIRELGELRPQVVVWDGSGVLARDPSPVSNQVVILELFIFLCPNATIL